MSLQLLHIIDLPDHSKPGGFDHAAVHRLSHRLYVSHTANDSIDVIDCATDRYLHSIPGLMGVAGALVSDELDLVFTSNRGENTVGVFSPGDEQNITKIPVGVRPNGLAFDAGRKLLLAANVGNPDAPGSFSLSMVDIEAKKMIHDIPSPGRTRWTVFDAQNGTFFVNISDPPQIVTVQAAHPDHIARTFEIPVAGPHGLDLDTAHRKLFCACDAGKLYTIDLLTGAIQSEAGLSGIPDVIFFNPGLHHLYVAIGDPGVIDVFDTHRMEKLESVPTEKGAHTIAFDAVRNKVYAFLPQTHQAAVFKDR